MALVDLLVLVGGQGKILNTKVISGLDWIEFETVGFGSS